MSNTQIDLYIDSFKEGDTIEYEGNEYIFKEIDGIYVKCENAEYFLLKDIRDDLEFGHSSLFDKYKDNEGKI